MRPQSTAGAQGRALGMAPGPTGPHNCTMSSAPANTKPSRKKLILVVEDDERICKVIEEAFQGQYRVRVVHDGMAGYVEATGSDRPDLIIADVEMPKLDGLGMIMRIRRAEQKHHVPVIFLTGRERPKDVIAGIRAGARHYLAKPLDVDLLRNKVEGTIKAA